MNKNKLQLFILGIILFSSAITIILANNKTILNILAGEDDKPKNINLSNVTANSFTLSYLTDKNALGTVKYGSEINNLDRIAIDDRDQLTQKIKPYTTHTITIRELEEKTKYYFLITSGENFYPSKNEFYMVETGEKITKNPSSQLPISGRVIDENNKPLKDILVFLKINGSQKLSSLTKENGYYTFPTNSLRNENLNDYFLISPEAQLTITAHSNEKNSSINILGLNTNPVIDLKLISSSNTNNSEALPTVKGPITSPIPTKTPTQKIDDSKENSSDIITFIESLTGIFK